MTVDDAPVEVAGDGTFAVTFPEPPAGVVDGARGRPRRQLARACAPRSPWSPRDADPADPGRPHDGDLVGDRLPARAGARHAAHRPDQHHRARPEGRVGRSSATTRRCRSPTRSARCSRATSSRRPWSRSTSWAGASSAASSPSATRSWRSYAWENGKRAPGDPGARRAASTLQYGGFTNFADPVVRKYNIDVAREAAAAGVDDILYDYIRRPGRAARHDGLPRPEGRRPGSRSSPSSARPATRSTRPGPSSARRCSASRPSGPRTSPRTSRRIARNVDYIAPLIYPSHWGSGASTTSPTPRSEPRDDHRRVAEGLQRAGRGQRRPRRALAPGLLAAGALRRRRRSAPRSKGAEDEGVEEWIMWDANVTYTRAACLKG